MFCAEDVSAGLFVISMSQVRPRPIRDTQGMRAMRPSRAGRAISSVSVETLGSKLFTGRHHRLS